MEVFSSKISDLNKQLSDKMISPETAGLYPFECMISRAPELKPLSDSRVVSYQYNFISRNLPTWRTGLINMDILRYTPENYPLLTEPQLQFSSLTRDPEKTVMLLEPESLDKLETLLTAIIFILGLLAILLVFFAIM